MKEITPNNSTPSNSSSSVSSWSSNMQSSLSTTSTSTASSRQLSRTSAAFTIQSLIDDILANRIKRIVVMTGAGISTASGIPDFRSSQTGLYNNLDEYDIPYPEAIFEKAFFRRNPEPFFRIAKDLMPNVEKYKPNRVHYFLRLLQEKKLLHRLYTQNIDGLESLAGIETDKLVEAHGSFRSARCLRCNAVHSGLYVNEQLKKNKIPVCSNGSDNCSGIVKPDIIFFGENLPNSFYNLHESDFLLADFILVMGTSLQVEPFANIIKKSRSNVPRLLLNKESVGPFKLIRKQSIYSTQINRDLQILGDLINCVELIVNKLGWKEELDALMNKELKVLDQFKNLILERSFFLLITEPSISQSNHRTKRRPPNHTNSKSRATTSLSNNRNYDDTKSIGTKSNGKPPPRPPTSSNVYASTLPDRLITSFGKSLTITTNSTRHEDSADSSDDSSGADSTVDSDLNNSRADNKRIFKTTTTSYLPAKRSYKYKKSHHPKSASSMSSSRYAGAGGNRTKLNNTGSNKLLLNINNLIASPPPQSAAPSNTDYYFYNNNNNNKANSNDSFRDQEQSKIFYSSKSVTANSKPLLANRRTQTQIITTKILTTLARHASNDVISVKS